MTGLLRTRLMAMMFAQYFIWGVWWVPFGSYLSHHGLDAWIGTIFSTQGWAAIIAPLFVGAIADRHVSAQKLMAVLNLAGGIILFGASLVGGSPAVMFSVVLGYLLCFMPTLALANAIAFAALSNTERQFPAIRVLGTIGWIIAGLIVGYLHAEESALPMRIAAGASIVFGLYCFTLPDTPPRAAGARPGLKTLLGLDAIGAMRDRSFWVLIACSLLLVIPLSFYYAYTNTFLVDVGVKGAAAVQSLGQVFEIGFLLALPFFFRRIGIKWVLMAGMLAWAVRYVLFAYGFNAAGPIMSLLVLGIVLHGVCYDFFFVSGQIYVDNKFPENTRARAQSFLALVTLGVGQVIGSLLANIVYVANTNAAGVHDWRAIWLIPAGLAFVVAIIFAVTFREKRRVVVVSRN